MIDHLLAAQCDASGFYSHPLVQTVLGDLHPGGAALTGEMLGHVPDPRGKRLLDVGCGHGASARMADALGFDVVAMDPDPQAIAQATRATESDAISFLQTDQLPAGPFDVVLSECSLCLMDNPQASIESFQRRLAPGGWLLLSDVTLASTDERLRSALARVACLAGALSHAQVDEGLERAGMDIVLSANRSALIGALRDRIHARLDVAACLEALGDHEIAALVEATERAWSRGELSYGVWVARNAA